MERNGSVIAMVKSISEPPRISLLLAKEAPIAVIIARVRAKLFHIMKWQYDKDILEHGSWFKGTIYHESSDVSFDGRHMVYFALNPKSGTFSWTAVCEPPFLKALAFWKHDSTWIGGGSFPEKHELELNMPRETLMENRIQHVPSRNIAKQYQFVYSNDRERINTRPSPSRRSGERQSPDGSSRLWFELANPSDPEAPRRLIVQTGSPPHNRENVFNGVSWADWDITGHLITVKEGIIKRLDLSDPTHPIQVLDLSGLQPPEKTEKLEIDDIL